MKPRKPKAEPSLRDKLSAAFLEAFQSDFEANGVAPIEQLRLKSPEKYSEIATRLIAASEPPSDGFEQCNSMEEIGVRLLRSVGLHAPTEEQIEAAILANDKFIAKLEAIRDRAQFGELTNGNADTVGAS
jgi:hypothetical protein